MIVEPEEGKTLNFIEQIIEEEIAAGKNGGKVHTRFPAGAEWIFTYRTCYFNMSQFRVGCKI